MNLEVKISTIYIWFAAQTLLSILFYLDDSFISGWEALFTFILSIPLTYLVRWMRGEFKVSEKNIENID